MKQVARIPLTRVPRALLDRKHTEEPVSYKRLYVAAVEGRIPAEQSANGRWSVADLDLPLIAEKLCDPIAA
jgi:hypothetical protein